MGELMILISIQLFIRWITLFEMRLIETQHLAFEQRSFQNLDRFSLIEAYSIHTTIQSFHKYTFKPIELTFSSGSVRIVFSDEKAHITYSLDSIEYAELSYDLVFDSAIEYQYTDEDEASWIDKQGD